SSALFSNTTGVDNTVTGSTALYYNTTGHRNTATGNGALQTNTTGGDNIALGFVAGFYLTTGDNNIDVGNEGVAGEANTIRIGRVQIETNPDFGAPIAAHTATFIAGINGVDKSSGSPVFIDANGQLGTGTLAT